MFGKILFFISLLILASCKPAGSAKSDKSNKSTEKEVKISVSSAGLITVENCKPDDTVKLINAPFPRGAARDGLIKSSCEADLVLWVDKPDAGKPYVTLFSGDKDKTISVKNKGQIYILGDKETCDLRACGKKDYLEKYEPQDVVNLGSFIGSNTVKLSFADGHDLDGDIDVVVQQWDDDKESYTANPLKNKHKTKAFEIVSSDDSDVNNTINIELDGHIKTQSRHHIWVRHEKGIELETPLHEAWRTPGVTPPPGAEF